MMMIIKIINIHVKMNCINKIIQKIACTKCKKHDET